ncbi:glycosyltransferase family 2 protein [Neoroseomonas soli]|uniref:Glycosyltransferase family 2 protein n=1 Tax=Neoroseomonas soli TaxID=1081025 RepID=A0A9X9X030_9PROT|nr:glycosyltransferase [Neoroseomonas soli]MBR0672759.1 glycosyltransferase family 2 protein [Neoroseomonas soli]
MPTPDLSILIAAHRVQDLVPAAVASVLDRAVGASVEVIVVSDDGTDYAPLLPADPRLRFTEVGPVRTGACAARNRGLAIATGAHVTMLDGDDAFEGPPDAIARALDLARPQGGVLVPTVVRAPDGTEVRRVPAPGARRFGFAEWGSAFSSLHLIARRAFVSRYESFTLIDDVITDLRTLAAVCGEVPVAEGLAYRYQLRAGQMTDTAGTRFDAEYAEALRRIAQDGFGFGAHAADAARVLRRWRAMNRLVGGGSGRPALGDYHRLVRAYLDGEWPAGRRGVMPPSLADDRIIDEAKGMARGAGGAAARETQTDASRHEG